MTDREKLVDLLETHCAVIGEVNCKASKGEKCTPKDCANCLADHLIAHGVTVRGPQKPLMVEEMYKKQSEIVYLEYAHNKLEEHPVLLTYFGEFYAEFDKFGLNYGFDKPIETYGFDWRCWAEKPTEEERKVAEWE